MTERRYGEDEVREIFERATETQQTARRQLQSGEGMTLAELQEIGGEVGIAPELVAQAARSLDSRGHRAAPPRFLGLPLRVEKTVDLGRRLSDEEWERLVVDLRETFDARGTVRSDGSFRQWTNGNLQALVEPTETGHRLRLRTLKGNSRALMLGGLFNVGVTAAMIVGFALTGKLADPGSVSAAVFLSTIGLGMFGVGALQLPSWARRRRKQMEDVAARLAIQSGAADLPEK